MKDEIGIKKLPHGVGNGKGRHKGWDKAVFLNRISNRFDE